MFGSLPTDVEVAAFRGVRRLPDQPNCWEIVGRQPEFELRVSHSVQPFCWAVLSFELYGDGATIDHCCLSTITMMGRQSIELPNARQRSGLIWLSSEARSIRIGFNTKASVVTINPVSIRYSSRAEA